MAVTIKVSPEEAKVMQDSLRILDIESIYSRTYLDIPYCTDSPAQKLDIILPNDGEGPFPVIVFIHGGGWHYGSKRNAHTVHAMQLPANGYALVTIDYRLSPEAPWPAQIYDCKTALRFIRAEGSKYQLDTSKILIMGNSASAHLAGVLAATGDHPDYEDRTMGYPDATSRVDGVCTLYGIFDFPALDRHWEAVAKYDQVPDLSEEGTRASAVMALLSGRADIHNTNARHASSYYHIHTTMPPMFLLHGSSDPIVPYLQSIEFFQKYQRYNDSKNIHLEILEGEGHGGSAFRSDEIRFKIYRWFDRILGLEERTYQPFITIPPVE